MSRSSDQRVFSRVRFFDPVEASSVVRSDQGWRLLSLDLSEGGMKLLSPEPFVVDARLVCEFEFDSDSEPVSGPIRIVGRVVWSDKIDYQERYNVGVEFVEMSESVRGRLRALIASRQ